MNTRVQIFVYIGLYGMIMVLFGWLGLKMFHDGRRGPAILAVVADLYLLVRIGLLARKLKDTGEPPSAY